MCHEEGHASIWRPETPDTTFEGPSAKTGPLPRERPRDSVLAESSLLSPGHVSSFSIFHSMPLPLKSA